MRDERKTVYSLIAVGREALAAGKDRAQVSRTLRLALLSPEIVHKALTGDLPVNAKDLMFGNIPAD